MLDFDMSFFDDMIDRAGYTEGIKTEKTEHYSDYDSSGSLSDFNVRDVLRTSISHKTNIPAAIKMHIPATMAMHDSLYDAMAKSPLGSGTNSDSDLDMDLDIPRKKGKKTKIEDEETAAMRRERNRLAAQRCRQRRRDRIEKLEKICQKLENDGDKLQVEITDLQKEMNELQRILENHNCVTKPIKTEIFMPTEKVIRSDW